MLANVVTGPGQVLGSNTSLSAFRKLWAET